jgi:hypothetical protein
MIHKRLLNLQRCRRLPHQFSWVGQRLVRDSYITRRSTQALALYLVLITVADAQRLSYYSDKTLTQWLSLARHSLHQARQQLLHLGLIAFEKPLYQVLALDEPPRLQTASPQPRQPPPLAIRARLRQALEGTHD